MNMIGLDIGTTSVCGICFSTESGRVQQVISRPNKSVVAGAHSWERLQDPAVLLAQVQEILEELTAAHPPVAAIGITGQMHGIVYVNDGGRAVGPLYTWQDGRGDELCRDGMSYAQYLSEKTGYALATGYGCVTHFYNQVNGLIPEEAVTFMTIHDYIVMTLAGRKTPLVHPSDGASFGMFDLGKRDFDRQAMEKVGLDSRYLPPIADGYTLLGTTSQGVPISVAIGDNQASVLGSVTADGSSILVNVGTGSQISCITHRIPEEAGLDCRPFVEGAYLVAGSSLCGGRAYSVLERFLAQSAQAITGVPVESAYGAMDRLMEGYTPAETPLVVDTTFAGTRQQPERRGSIRNISTDNLTMANLCDGVMRGMAEELFSYYEKMKPYCGGKTTRMVASGNGVRLNSALRRRFIQIFRLPMVIPAHKEEAAFGAVLFAALATGHAADLKQAQGWIQYE